MGKGLIGPGLLSCAIAALVLCAASAWAAGPDVQDIIKRSVEANNRDFQADPHFSYKELSKTDKTSRAYQVYMIAGSPYQKLIAVGGKPLSPAQQAQENKKEQQVRQQRAVESAADRQQRITKYERDRNRDHAMMEQLTQAFTFKLIGEHKLKGFDVYVLSATPKPGYQPPNMQTQVLKGMQGELWIDQKTYQWVKVTAQVIHPVSIEGFLAQVEPGTRFEVEKAPVGDGSIWLTSHFAMRSSARVLHFLARTAQEDDTFWDYQRVK